MKNIYASLLLMGTLAATSCKKKEEDVKPANPVVNIEATMNGASQSTPNSSQATGTLTGTYNRDTKEISYTIRYQGMAPTLGHFHRQATGRTDGPVSVPFPQLNDPIIGKATLSAADDESIANGTFYANLHSTQYPGGEIRGNLKIK